MMGTEVAKGDVEEQPKAQEHSTVDLGEGRETWGSWATARLAVSIYFLRSLVESVGGLVSSPFRSLREKPSISSQPTELNKFLVENTPSLQSYTCTPWAPGPISQTVLGLAMNTGSPLYQRRELLMADDGVELLLDWKEDEDLPEDTPIMLILHGIGGGSESRLARHITDEVKRHKWRAVVFNRRGHGESSVMPGHMAPITPYGQAPPKKPKNTYITRRVAQLSEALSRRVRRKTNDNNTQSPTTTTTTTNAPFQASTAPVPSPTTLASSPSHNATPSALPEVPAVHQLSTPNSSPADTANHTQPPTPAPEPSVVQPLLDLAPAVSILGTAVPDIDLYASATAVTSVEAVMAVVASDNGNAALGNKGAASEENVTSDMTGLRDPSPACELAPAPVQQHDTQQQADVGSSGPHISLIVGVDGAQNACDEIRPNVDVDVGGVPHLSPIKTSGPRPVIPIVANAHTRRSASPQVRRSLPRKRRSCSGTPSHQEGGLEGEECDLLDIETPPPPDTRRPESLIQVRRAFPRHSDTDDLQEVVAHLQAQYPKAPIVCLGFSQGSNLLVHFLGQQPLGAKQPFTAAISVSNAYDLQLGTLQLSKDWVTDAVITRPIKRLLKKELKAVRQIAAAHGLQIDLDRALAAQSIREFDAALVTAWGYQTVEDYYVAQSSRAVMHDIRVPLMLINNVDDPIIHESLPALAKQATEVNPWLISICTQRGGHLGWLQGWSGSAWMCDVLIQYAKAAVQAAAQGLIRQQHVTLDPTLDNQV